MATKGIFALVGDQYALGAGNTFVYCRRVPLFFRLFLLPMALLQASLLFCISLCFRLLFLFDWVSALVDSIRSSILTFLQGLQHGIDRSLFQFLFNPPIMVAIVPIFILSAILPKFSSQISVEFDDQGLGDGGIFATMNKICWGSSSALFGYVSRAHILMMPFLAVIAFVYSIVLIIVGAAAFVLIVLDWFSSAVEKMRRFCVWLTQSMAQKIADDLFNFVIYTASMILIAPVILLVLVIPKISTSMDQ